jgi:hypothetical protein
MFRRSLLVLVAAIAAVPLAAGSADAAGTGASYNSPAQAGYAATGAHFIYAGAHITLPNASRFARELGTVQFGVQLWNGSTVIDVGAVACTDSTCKPGGKPEVRDYHPVLRVFSRKTGALICSAAHGNCGSPSSSGWAHASFRPGTSIDITVSYPRPFTGMVDGQVGSADYIAWPISPGVTFSQARIAATFGPTPFVAAPFRAPARAMRLATFFEPPGPPYEAELANSAGTSACLGKPPVFTRHYLRLTKDGGATHVRATAGALSGGDGCNFSVYLEPA